MTKSYLKMKCSYELIGKLKLTKLADMKKRQESRQPNDMAPCYGQYYGLSKTLSDSNAELHSNMNNNNGKFNFSPGQVLVLQWTSGIGGHADIRGNSSKESISAEGAPSTKKGSIGEG